MIADGVWQMSSTGLSIPTRATVEFIEGPAFTAQARWRTAFLLRSPSNASWLLHRLPT